MPYPLRRFFPSHAAPPDWVAQLTAVFTATKGEIDSAAEHPKRMESDAALGVIAPGLTALGFAVEQGKKKGGKLPRPVFFGDEGKVVRNYEIDAFSSEYVVVARR